MAEKLTKSAIKDELMRRIDWYERCFKFNKDMTNADISKDYFHFGRYRTYVDILWQVENGCFKGGYVS